MSKKVMRSAAVAVGIAGAMVASLMVGGTAAADPGYHYPNSVYYTGPGNLAGVGSDTIQSVENALAKSIDATASSTDKFESWDAIDPTNLSKHGKIATKGTSFITNGFERPNGSGEGLAALSRSYDKGAWPVGDGTTTTLNGKVNYSRSSSGTGHYTSSETLVLIPFARDAVSYAYIDSTGHLNNLTKAQLTGIYQGSITSISGTTVVPWLPQAGSGTRKFFLAAIGVTDNAALVALVGSHVTEENDATALTTGAVFPFSAAQWISQKNGVVTNHTASAALASIKLNGTTPVSPTTGSGSTLAPNSAFYNDTTFGRDVFNVIPSDQSRNTASGLYHLFVTNSSHTALFGTSSAQAIITQYGFLNVSYAGDATNAAGHTNTSPLVANPSSL